jgi:hypothetical protein
MYVQTLAQNHRPVYHFSYEQGLQQSRSPVGQQPLQQEHMISSDKKIGIDQIFFMINSVLLEILLIPLV